MKYVFSFIQVVNWLIVCRGSLQKMADQVLEKSIEEDEVIKLLEKEKHKLQLLKDVLNRKGNLRGIQPDFIKNLENIKKEYLK